MAKIAFLGLGQMGSVMATRLVNAGHELVVWNRTSERATPLAKLGARVVGTPAETASDVEFAITMLATPQALEQVLFGEMGLGTELRPNQILIDMSTVGPGAIHSISNRLPAGVALVDSPVSGSIPQATAGSLNIFVGATEEEFERVRSILEVFGHVRHTGGPGSGAAMKLVINLALGAAIVTLGESLALGEALSLESGMILDVLSNSSIGPIVQAKRTNLESGHYDPNFKLELAEKDLRLVCEAAAINNLDLRLARMVRAWLEDAVVRGGGSLDFSAVVPVILGKDAW